MGSESDGRRCDCLPATLVVFGYMTIALPRPIRACFATCMSELNTRYGTSCLNCLGNGDEGFALLVAP